MANNKEDDSNSIINDFIHSINVVNVKLSPPSVPHTPKRECGINH